MDDHLGRAYERDTFEGKVCRVRLRAGRRVGWALAKGRSALRAALISGAHHTSRLLKNPSLMTRKVKAKGPVLLSFHP